MPTWKEKFRELSEAEEQAQKAGDVAGIKKSKHETAMLLNRYVQAGKPSRDSKIPE